MQLLSTLRFLFAVNFIGFVSAARHAGECAAMCNDLRTEVLTLAMCRDAKRTLPRPKVGDFCSTAMEQGFSDACVALCMNETPKHRVAQTCRAAAIEMPRPTIRRWCEHGYNVAFAKTTKDLANRWANEAPEPELEPFFEEEIFTPEEETVFVPEEHVHHHHEEEQQEQEHRHVEPEQAAPASRLRGHAAASKPAEVEPADESRAVLATIPITLDDVTNDLVVYEGQNAEEAVVIFCREHSAADVSTCIRQLLTVVIEKLDELQNV